MKKNFKLILIIIWMVVIFMFSQQNAVSSLNTSEGLLYDILSIFKLSHENIINLIDILGGPIRKLAHFSEYAILGLLVLYYLNDYQSLSIKRIIVYEILFCFLYACSDEIHQYFIPGRAMMFKDVLIDTSGSILSAIGYSLCKK